MFDPGISAGLVNIILKCLEKFARSVVAGQSLADPAQEYFSDGMTEELISALAQISSLRIISRTSVMQYEGVHKSLPQIARELGVDGIVAGSVAHFADSKRVRITAELIEAATDRNLWAQSYERDLGDVFALQNDVARNIALQIRVKLTPEEQERLTSSRSVNSEAHGTYLKAAITGVRIRKRS
jgi:TolB-like protein